MRILLVEDDILLGDALRAKFASMGAEIYWAQTVGDAFRQHKLHNPDIVLLDRQLPDGDGFGLLKWIRSSPSTTTVIVMSARDEMSAKIECFRAGADDYITKPFDLRELVLRVGKLTPELAANDGLQPAHVSDIVQCRPAPRDIEPARDVTSRRKRFKLFSLGRKSLIAAIAIAAIAGGYLGFLQLSGNFHTVVEGELYRSAQPTAHQLESYVKDHGIKTVINLRGASPNSAWYKEEIAASSRLDVKHVDFRMSAGRVLTSDKAEELLAILRTAPKPILIHCKSGADRTGLAAVIYSQQIAGLSDGLAEAQLSIRYGHVGLPYLSSTFAMDSSWEDLERHFGVEGSAGDQHGSDNAT